MATSTHTQRLGRIALLLLGATLLAAGLYLTASGASAQVALGSLDVTGANETIEGNVTDVHLDTTVAYSHSVPDAQRRLVRLRAGPTEGDLTLIDYQQTRDPQGSASGSVALSGSVLQHEGFNASQFDPAVASTSSREIVVEAVVEVRRLNGDSVTRRVQDTVVVTLRDGTSLSAKVGGEGDVSVSTDA